MKTIARSLMAMGVISRIILISNAVPAFFPHPASLTQRIKKNDELSRLVII
ncbi:hypothetical protein [Pectobacterium aroidearum]|uniref:hypothetical protein n=1 Tax=Pectobacterium aroidearum TaxID=1201031 RepID=UPI002115A78A|nr:hypothetical protein [Pectobacterium aroidearum]UUE44057.1 hypothetical protein L0Y28_16160 [Pectobacterium aroidearum]UUE60891.1 hypothetical protein L0Y29_16160 [Pectobacterium aroidearum]UUE65113.1 hypothetical protein L0Y22_16160 [Pectobacterium aroidearum]